MIICILERLEKVRETFYRNCNGPTSLKKLFMHAAVEMFDSGFIKKPLQTYKGPEFYVSYISPHLFEKNGVYYFDAILWDYTTGFIYVMDQFFSQDFIDPLYYHYKGLRKERDFVAMKIKEAEEKYN